MTIFSKETLLIAKNWDTVAEILTAREQLENQFTALLRSVGSELARQAWWQDGWVFVPSTKEQVYISKQQWKIGEIYVLWIGVENFAPANVFGLQEAPRLYVWLHPSHRNLVSHLIKVLKKFEEELSGEFDHRTSNSYVIRHEVMKCPPELAETFGPEAKQQIIDFFTQYAAMSKHFEPVIRDYLSNLQAK